MSIKYHIHVTLRHFILHGRVMLLRKIWGMNIDPTVRISLKANLDKTNPKGIFIGPNTYVAFGASILSHDMSRSLHCTTKIGQCCFIGANSIILPGISIGDHCIVGAGSVVTKNIPNNCIVAGNPATIKRSDINTGNLGILIEK